MHERRNPLEEDSIRFRKKKEEKKRKLKKIDQIR